MGSKKADETIIDVAEAYSKTETFFNDNGKRLTTLFVAALVVIAGYFAYQKFVVQKQEKTAAAEIWKAEWWFEKDSLDLALNGNGAYMGFETIADSYGGTPTGNLAAQYAGMIYMAKEDYPSAIAMLEKASLGDMMHESARLGALGDAHVQQGNLSEGINYYEKAVSHSNNDLTAPVFLKKLGLTYEKSGDMGKAYDAYVRLKSEFSSSTSAKDIDKFIGRVAPFAS